MSQIHKPYQPVITGTPGATGMSAPKKAQMQAGPSFQELLEQRILEQQTPQPLTFSRHAQERTAQRNIALSTGDLERLGEAVGRAEGKGLKDTLVFMDNTAFIVNVPNRVVVTVVDSGETEHAVFTNIDGAVIV